jgi:hypothetical protein
VLGVYYIAQVYTLCGTGYTVNYTIYNPLQYVTTHVVKHCI